MRSPSTLLGTAECNERGVSCPASTTVRPRHCIRLAHRGGTLTHARTHAHAPATSEQIHRRGWPIDAATFHALVKQSQVQRASEDAAVDRQTDGRMEKGPWQQQDAGWSVHQLGAYENQYASLLTAD